MIETREHWQSATEAAGPAFVPGDRWETPDEPTSEHALGRARKA